MQARSLKVAATESARDGSPKARTWTRAGTIGHTLHDAAESKPHSPVGMEAQTSPLSRNMRRSLSKSWPYWVESAQRSGAFLRTSARAFDTYSHPRTVSFDAPQALAAELLSKGTQAPDAGDARKSAASIVRAGVALTSACPSVAFDTVGAPAHLWGTRIFRESRSPGGRLPCRAASGAWSRVARARASTEVQQSAQKEGRRRRAAHRTRLHFPAA